MAVTLTPLPLDLLSELFTYSPETGFLAWRDPAMASRAAGRGKPEAARAQAGKMNGRRRIVRVQGHDRWAVSICWALHYGAWPPVTPSLANGIPDDLRADNLTLTDTPLRRQAGGYRSQIHLDMTDDELEEFRSMQAAQAARANALRAQGVPESEIFDTGDDPLG